MTPIFYNNNLITVYLLQVTTDAFLDDRRRSYDFASSLPRTVFRLYSDNRTISL